MGDVRATAAMAVQAFSRDAAEGGYVYTREGRLSSALSNARMTAAISDALPLAGLKVVDMGCGDGTYTTGLVTRDRAASVLGIDPATDAVAFARTRATHIDGCDFRAAAINDLPVAEQYDVAILRGVLHHLNDPDVAIAKALEIARFAVILEPNGLNPVLKMIERMSRYHREHGEKSYAPAQLRRWIEAAGGHVVSRKFMGLVPFFCPAWMARLLKIAEPLAEALPGIRAVGCGQLVIVAARGGAAR